MVGCCCRRGGQVDGEAKCNDYCNAFLQAYLRCPTLYRGEAQTFDECMWECLMPENNKDGTEQDFVLTDTLQCRQNHARMAIKEGLLTNTVHCLHMRAGNTDRCSSTGEIAIQQYTEYIQGEGVYRLANSIIDETADDAALKMFAAITYAIALRGRLYTTYPNPDVPGGPSCTDDTSMTVKYRSPDGTCNSKSMPKMGSTGTPFVRNLDASSPRSDLPSVADVAAILQRPRQETDPSTRAAPFNQIATAWIQFMTHDWFAHDVSETESPFHNTVTHWWDASQMYGSTPEQVAAVRAEGGKLHLDENDELDYEGNGNGGKKKPITGFGENFWVGLHMMHTLFAREHNYIVDQLESTYPGEMTDDEKFETARLCLAAILAKIHTIEWTPTLLDNKAQRFAMSAQWNGLLGAALETFTLEQIGPLQGTLSGARVPQFGSPDFTTEQTLFDTSFFMTEEFVAVYRMHPLLPDNIQLVDGSNRNIPLSQLTFSDARHLVKEDTTQTFLEAFGHAPARTLSLQNYPYALYNLKIPGTKGTVNLAEIDLQRDRERGLPRYNDARRQLLMEPYSSLNDLTSDPEELALLESVYDDIDQVDFMVGSLVDRDRHEGFAFGLVPFHIFVVMASRRIFSDRFFQESFNAEHYTAWGIDYVSSTDFRDILVRHFPDLDGDIPDNPFANW